MHMMTNDRVMVHDEFEREWKKAVVAYFKGIQDTELTTFYTCVNIYSLVIEKRVSIIRQSSIIFMRPATFNSTSSFTFSLSICLEGLMKTAKNRGRDNRLL